MAKTQKYTFQQIAGGIIIPILVLLIGLAAYFLLLPKYKSVKAVKGTVGQKQNELRAREGQLQSIHQLVRDLDAKKEELAVIDEAIPPAPRIPELLANIDHLARQSGISITNLEITSAAVLSTLQAGSEVGQVKKAEKILGSTKNLGIMQAELRLKGRYPNFKSFILNTEQNLRLMDIDSVLAGAVDEDSKLQEFSLKIQTYYQKQ